jgi:hypothetical protein
MNELNKQQEEQLLEESRERDFEKDISVTTFIKFKECWKDGAVPEI